MSQVRDAARLRRGRRDGADAEELKKEPNSPAIPVADAAIASMPTRKECAPSTSTNVRSAELGCKNAMTAKPMANKPRSKNSHHLREIASINDTSSNGRGGRSYVFIATSSSRRLSDARMIVAGPFPPIRERCWVDNSPLSARTVDSQSNRTHQFEISQRERPPNEIIRF